MARNSRHTRIHTTGSPSNEHSGTDNYSNDGNHSAPYVEEQENLAEIFADCESFGERVSSTRALLYNVGARVEAGVRVAFEEQKRKEALEIAKLKKAGHHVANTGALTPVSTIKRVTTSDLGGNSLDLGNNNNNIIMVITITPKIIITRTSVTSISKYPNLRIPSSKSVSGAFN